MEENKKVAVVMSTYNGEKYLKEQIDSILNQTYKNIVIVIRDDGSKDGSVNIIEEYMKENDNIILHKGENIGFVNSFFNILGYVDADYYAYADQDDIWLPEKIKLAVNELNKFDNSVPNMVFGDSDYYDENMNFMGFGPKNRKHSFLMSLFSCVGQGMTFTINKEARDLIIKNRPESCFFHDWWTYILCEGLGNVGQNNVVVVKYRRRKKNATSEGQGYIRLLIWRIKNLVFGSGMKEIKGQMLNFKNIYGDKISDDKKEILELFATEKYDFFKAIKKTFYPKRIRSKLLDEIMLRFLFLIGTM